MITYRIHWAGPVLAGIQRCTVCHAILPPFNHLKEHWPKGAQVGEAENAKVPIWYDRVERQDFPLDPDERFCTVEVRYDPAWRP